MGVERATILKRLLRSIELSQGEFALLLALCNAPEVQEGVLADLRIRFGAGLYLCSVEPAAGAVNLVDLLEKAPAGTDRKSVV